MKICLAAKFSTISNSQTFPVLEKRGDDFSLSCP